MAKAIMIQGTASGAGKSLLTAGLCRIFRQDGFRVAPFKSQNMALNSFVTEEGLEMGRAQVVQAQCAGLTPDVRMNPILLKPNSDTGSQVVVMGEPIGNMRASEYFQYKKKLIPVILEAWRSLADEHDVMVVEGAGSPAEINLKQEDLVNMGLARMVRAPVLLVANIDPGGMFASVAGTMLLLEPEEREYVKGIIVNRFRGDRSILQPGLDRLEEIVGKPVLGVVPYLDVVLEEEDGASLRSEKGQDGEIHIAVIRLPHISNFTDFDALAITPDLSLQYVGRPDQLEYADLIILPGTKNTPGDLRWLRETGMADAVVRHAGAGRPVIGICGGYQMLGTVVRDPHRIESGGEIPGLGLLEMETTITDQKKRCQVEARFLTVDGIFSGLSGIEFSGYEIHMGRAETDREPICSVKDASGMRSDGAGKGNIYGSYIHGLFDSAAVRSVILQALAEAKGVTLSKEKLQDYSMFREQQFDLLAHSLRSALDMNRIYRILEEGMEVIPERQQV